VTKRVDVLPPRGTQTTSVVLITATEPEPRTFGKQVVMGGLLDHLCRRLGNGRVHVILLGRLARDRPSTPYQLHVVGKPTALEQLVAVAHRVLLPPNSSLQEAALWSPRVLRSLRGILDGLKADLEIWDTMRTGQYARNLPRRPRVLYADDLFSNRYASMLARGRHDSSPIVNPLGQFAKMLPGPVARIAAQPWASRPLLWAEQKLTTRSENAALQHFDTTVLVSSAETAELTHRTGSTTVRTLLPLIRPPGIGRRRYGGAPVFVFLGGMDFPPNRDGLTWFLSSCRTAVLRALPDFRLLVVGRGSDQALPDEAQAWGDHVRPLGWVDNLDDVLFSCAGLISPLRIGSGTKIKVLEALARGLPVVATPHGVLGLNVGRQDGCLVGHSPGELAALLTETADVANNATLSEAAQHSWAQRFCPPVAGLAYDDLFRLTGTRRPLDRA
jgi:glycosyltransferase involved in cell wall biosynthesis